MLLENGADPNAQDYIYNTTSLMMVSLYDTITVTDVYITASDGMHWTEVIMGVYLRYKAINITRLLLDYGADPQIKNSRGETAFTIAKNAKQDKIAEIIKLAETQ